MTSVQQILKVDVYSFIFRIAIEPQYASCMHLLFLFLFLLEGLFTVFHLSIPVASLSEKGTRSKIASLWNYVLGFVWFGITLLLLQIIKLTWLV